MTFKLKIPILPKTTNSMSRMHWRTKSKHANIVKHIMHLHLINYIPKVPYKKAKFVLTRHASGRPPDFDGLVSSFKWVLDSFVKSGLIIDDSMEVIGQPEYRHEKAPRLKGFITIEFEGIM